MAEKAIIIGLFLTSNFGLSLTQGTENLLTPPYFNLAYERSVEASATCGVGAGVTEAYCNLGSALCDICVSEEQAMLLGERSPQQMQYYTDRIHSPAYAVDGSERWWQSPPLSRGLQYNEVNLTINLGQVRTMIAIILLLYRRVHVYYRNFHHVIY